MSLHTRIKKLFEEHPITMGFLLAAMVVEGWRLTILYLISTNTLIPALIFALLIQSTIFFLAVLGYVKASVMLGIISAVLSGISFIPFLDIKYKDSTTIVLTKRLDMPEFKSFQSEAAQYAFNLKYYEDVANAKKANIAIDKDNETLKQQFPTLKKEAGYDYYAAIIVVLIASIFPSTVVVVVSHQVSRFKFDIVSTKPLVYNKMELNTPAIPKSYNEKELSKPVTLKPVDPSDRNYQLVLDWNSRKYSTMTALANAYNISSQRASAILKKYNNEV